MEDPAAKDSAGSAWRLLRRGFAAAALAAASLGVAAAQTPAPTPWAPPSNLPVIFESDDARDNLYEAATDAAAQLHFQERVPLSQLTVPCGSGSTISPYSCVNGTFHQRYKDWIAQHPGLIEIGQHGVAHTEMLGTMSFADQLNFVGKGLQEMESWGLPARPFAFSPPFSSQNRETIAVEQQLGFRTSIVNSGTCYPATGMNQFCESVSPCARGAVGNRVAGPECVLLPPESVIDQVNARQNEGKVFVVYHMQDLVRSDLATVDPSKLGALQAILQAFAREQAAGHYRLMTFGSFYQSTGGPTPTPTPGGDATIYQDALAYPWVDASWSASVTYDSSSRVFSGTSAIRVVETGFGALAVRSGEWGAPRSRSPADFKAVSFEIFPETSGLTLAVRLENDAAAKFPQVVVGSIPAGQWTKVTVAMTALDPSGTPFDSIDVFDANGTNQTYDVDDYRLVGSASSEPLPTATPTPPPTSATPTSAAATPTPTAPRPTPVPSATSTPSLRTTTIGAYDPRSSAFFLRNQNSAGVADVGFVYGPAGSGWTPIAGDWDGDGVTTVGLYDPRSGTFYLRNRNAAGNADVAFAYGPAGSGWRPLAGDWIAQGIATIGLHDPVAGSFYLRYANAAGPADARFAYGAPNTGSLPLAGDWDGR